MSEGCNAFTRIIENIPILGHLVAMCHACCKKTAFAERAGLKASMGICLCPCNCIAESVDECSRTKSPKLYSFALTSRTKWMKKYHRYTLKQICLPGSHQSTTYTIHSKLAAVPMAHGWSKCQNLSLLAQLRGGIRFLDLRIMSEKDGEIWTHHNVVKCMKLREVLDIVRTFVSDYRSEIVGLNITNDGKPIDWGACHSLLNEYLRDRLIFEHMKEMLIADIVDQGRNIFIIGVPDVAYSWRGINCYWPNKQWPEELRQEMERTISDLSAATTTDMFWYKAECTPFTEMIVRGLGGVPGAAMSCKADEKFEFVEDLATSVNFMISAVFEDLQQNPFQIFTTDYVQDEIVDRILQLNGVFSEYDETFIVSSPNQTLLSGVSNENMLGTNQSMGNKPQNLSSPKGYQPLGDSSSFETSNTVNSGAVRTSLQQDRNSSLVRVPQGRKPIHNVSVRSSNPSIRASNLSVRASSQTLGHNTTISSMSGQFEMPIRKAPALEVKETTM